MSYNVTFKVKVEGVDEYVPIGECDANIVWNVRGIIQAATGLDWINKENNGFCKDVIPKIAHGYADLLKCPGNYKPFEPPVNGTVEHTRKFLKLILDNWEKFCDEHNENLQNAATFWIE